MSLYFLTMNNHATVPIATVNISTLVTLTSFSTITTTAIYSALGIVSTNPAPPISVTTTGQDLNFETRLNTIENYIFKLWSTLEKFISANNLSGKPQGENDREYLTDFSVNASSSEIYQSSDDAWRYNTSIISPWMMRVRPTSSEES